MEKIGICILDNDDDFKTALIQYLNSSYDNYSFCIPDKVNKTVFKKMLTENHVIVTSDKYIDLVNDYIEKSQNELLKKQSLLATKLIMIYENLEKQNYALLTQVDWIYKHGSIEKLISIIRDKYKNNNKRQIGFENNKDTKIICCLGLSGGSGVTSISRGIALEMSKTKGYRTCYISFEEFESKSHDVSSKSHEELAYSLLSDEKDEYEHKLENAMIEGIGGVWSLPNSKYKNVLLDFNQEEKLEYINRLLNKATFDYMILDLSNRIDEFTEFVIRNSYNIFLIERHDSQKKHLLDKTIKLICSITNNKIKLITVENMLINSETQNFTDAVPIVKSNINSVGIGNDLEFMEGIKSLTGYLS